MNWPSWARAIVSGLWWIIGWAFEVNLPSLDLRSREERERAARDEAMKASAARARLNAMFSADRALAELDDRHARGSIFDAEYTAERDAILATRPSPAPRVSPLHDGRFWLVVVAMMLAAYVLAIAAVGHVVLSIADPNGVPTGSWLATVAGAAGLGLAGFAAASKVEIPGGSYLIIGVPTLVLLVVFGLVRPS